jgi:hypothetical protein
MRPGAYGRNSPFLEAHFDGTGNDDGFGNIAFGETFREVVGDRGDQLNWDTRSLGQRVIGSSALDIGHGTADI